MRGTTDRKGERGVSILLVAVCLAALLAMAASAIDVVTLYVARTEAQRASDASALAGARMIAASGYTSSGISWNGATTSPLYHRGSRCSGGGESAGGSGCGAEPDCWTSCGRLTDHLQYERRQSPDHGYDSTNQLTHVFCENMGANGQQRERHIDCGGLQPLLAQRVAAADSCLGQTLAAAKLRPLQCHSTQ